MTIKADYSKEEWLQLLQAPVNVGVLIITADIGVTSMVGEMKGMYKGMVEQPVDEGAQDLIAALLQEIKEKSENKEKLELPDTSGKDAEAVKDELMQSLTDAAALVDAKCSAEEAAGYKKWLMGVGQATAEAGKEGGFLGIGAVRVSDKEKAALEEISAAIGV